MKIFQLMVYGRTIKYCPKIFNRSRKHRKLYTQLKIDEINNLGEAKIRLRSLVAAMAVD